MRLNPDTLRAHRARTRYPPHTLAPDPHQLELSLRPMPCPTRRRFMDVCPRCRCLHSSPADAANCRQANADREQP